MKRGYPGGAELVSGRRMERGKDCVERNRSERAKVANVAEWNPPASPESGYQGEAFGTVPWYSWRLRTERSSAIRSEIAWATARAAATVVKYGTLYMREARRM